MSPELCLDGPGVLLLQPRLLSLMVQLCGKPADSLSQLALLPGLTAMLWSLGSPPPGVFLEGVL